MDGQDIVELVCWAVIVISLIAAAINRIKYRKIARRIQQQREETAYLMNRISGTLPTLAE